MKTPFVAVVPVLMIALALPSVESYPLTPLAVTAGTVRADVGPDGVLKPGEIGTVRFTFKVSIPSTAGLGVAVCPLSYIMVEFAVQNLPSYAVASLSPASQTVELTPQTTSRTVETTLSIMTSKAAPKAEAGVYTVHVFASPDSDLTCMYGNSHAWADAMVVNG